MAQLKKIFFNRFGNHVRKRNNKEKEKCRESRSSSLEEAFMSPWRFTFGTGDDSCGVDNGCEDYACSDSVSLTNSPVFIKKPEPLSPLLDKHLSPDGTAAGSSGVDPEQAISRVKRPTPEVSIKRIMIKSS